MPRKARTIILLSGGLDSTVNLHLATVRSRPVLALTFDYGQRAASREISACRKISTHYGVKHKVMHLDWLKRLTQTALVNHRKALPHLSMEGLDDVRGAAAESALQVWVPNRNAVFVHIAAAFAEGMDCSAIVVGFNAEEAATFPDNSTEFLRATNKALKLSTLKMVSVVCYTQRMRKTGIVRLAKRIGVPLNLVWPCYEGGRSPCWQCEGCLRFQRALQRTRNWDSYREMCKR